MSTPSKIDQAFAKMIKDVRAAAPGGRVVSDRIIASLGVYAFAVSAAREHWSDGKEPDVWHEVTTNVRIILGAAYVRCLGLDNEASASSWADWFEASAKQFSARVAACIRDLPGERQRRRMAGTVISRVPAVS